MMNFKFIVGQFSVNEHIIISNDISFAGLIAGLSVKLLSKVGSLRKSNRTFALRDSTTNISM